MIGDDEFVEAADAVLRSSPDDAGVRQLEWSPDVDVRDPDQLQMFAAICRAEGRTLAVTSTLGAAIAAALLDSGHDVTLDWGFAHANKIGGDETQAVGAPRCESSSPVVLDLGEGGLALATTFEVVELASPGLDEIVRQGIIRTDDVQQLTVPDLDDRRARAFGLASIAISHHILGACEEAFHAALTYTEMRTQFGRTIASMQAVQHMLAESLAQLVGLRAAGAKVLHPRSFADRLGSVDTMLLKALAGRVAGTVMQNALQAFGAIGFTWDHPHHRYWRRVATLDAFGGGYEALRHEIGARAIAEGVHRTPMFVD